MPEDDAAVADVDRQKAPFHAVKAVPLFVLAGSAAGVLVAPRSAGELVQAGVGMLRVVLPVPIAADDEEIVGHVLLHPRAELISFVLETFIGEVVVLVLAVGSDDRRRADEHLPRRVA